MRKTTTLASVVLALVLVVAALAYLLSAREPEAERAGTPATAGGAPGRADETLTLYFSRGDSSVPVWRTARGQAEGPEAALRELLRGPTSAEQDSGISSWFSRETAGMLRSFRLDPNGVAHVDFADLTRVIPSASSSAGSALLLRELNGTLFQYPQIEAIEYSITGSCDRFWNWLQYDCEVVRREEAG